MSIDTLINSIVTAITTSTTINTWTMTNYTKMITVYKGVDMDNPPSPSVDYPVVAVFPHARQAGYAEENKITTIGLICAVVNETLTSTEVTVEGTENKSVKKVYTGIANIEALRALVLAAIQPVAPAGSNIMSLSDEYENIECYPEFLVREIIEIHTPISCGDNALD